MILVLDNFDSFTWNIVHAVAAVAPGAEVRVVRSDRINARGASGLHPSHIIVSPGPCGPREAGNSVTIIRELAGRVPILGICLGHQCIAAALGLRVVRAPAPVHGTPSLVHHDGRTIFSGLPTPFAAMRYHSLAVEPDSVEPDRWQVSAWHDPHATSSCEPPSAAALASPPISDSTAAHSGRLIMGLRYSAAAGRAPVEGVQFHPESFGTPVGNRLIANFLNLSADVRGDLPTI